MKVERIDIDDEIVDCLSTAVQSSVDTGITRMYGEVSKSSNKNFSASTVIPKDTIKIVAKEIALEERRRKRKN